MEKKRPTNNVVLFSGGIDSLFTALYLLDKYPEEKLEAVYFNTNSLHSALEQKSAELLAKKLKLNLIIDRSLDLSVYGKQSYIPYRNLLFAIQGLQYGSIVWVGGLKENAYRDASYEAFESMEKCLNVIDEAKIQLKSPFWDYTKKEAIEWFLYKNYPESLLEASWSCYSETSLPCGECRYCFRKWVALESLNIECRHWFEQDPSKSKLAKKYYNKVLNSNGYDAQRVKDTIKVFKKYI